MQDEQRVHFLSANSSNGQRATEARGLLFSGDSVVIEGDAASALDHLPRESVQTTITSPPYWGLRDYSLPGQIGAEEDPAEYVEHVTTVLEAVGRVTKPSGTLWLNVGDSYTSGGRTWRAPDKKNPVRAMSYRAPTPEGLKPKDLVGIPWQLAFAAQRAGWYLRSDIIWHKPNCMPESVKDRPTRSHEYLFLFSKSEKYFYDPAGDRGPNGRNLRTVWDIPTEPFHGPHFAVFPTALVERCLRLTTQTGDLVLDPFIGSGTVGVAALALGRRFAGIDLSPEYVQMCKTRISALQGALQV